MKRTIFILILTSLTSTKAFTQNVDLYTFLKLMFPDAEMNILEASDHFKAEYEILIPQMVDHKDMKAGIFEQRIYIAHYDVSAPVVLVTEGYATRNYTTEIARELSANQITVEYRYFGKSVPEDKDWDYLTNMEAVKDLHAIRTIMGRFYKHDKWLATGVSKGGTTCLFYKAFYPKDTKVAVPYVGPMPDSPTDPRCDNHLLTVGDENCRKDLAEFQQSVLDQKEEIIPMINAMAEKRGITFSMGTEKALEYSTLEFTFSFWQMGHSCDEIPENADAQTTFDYLSSVSGFDFYCDQVIKVYEPAFYQFMTENGYYGFVHEHLDDKITALTEFDNSYFAPKDVDLTYQPKFMKKAKRKLKKRKNILQIHGALDPWAACGLPLQGKEQYYFVKEDGAHSTRISSFDDKTQEEIWGIINRWLNE